MQTTLSRWGNSLAVRLPKAAVETLQLAEGAALELTVSKGRIEIVPAGPTAESYLAALQAAVAAGITPDRDPVWDDPPPAGDEIW